MKSLVCERSRSTFRAMTPALIRAAAAALLVSLSVASPLRADDSPWPIPEPKPGGLPADVTSKQNAVVGGDTLAYTASVEAVPLSDPKGERLAEVVVTSYTLIRENPATRPITYAFNGGPGAASAYLNFGAIGPKRLPFGNEGNGPSDPPALTDNAESWLAFTDLVFVDPVGTGYSRALGSDEAQKNFWSVDGDIDALSRVVAKHLAAKNRLMSPVYLAGESYGGFRAPRIARALQTKEGVGVRGLIAISPVLDFGIRQAEQTSPIPWVNALPSMAATARERKAPVTRADLSDVESYATGQFLSDLMRGPRDKEAVERIVTQVSQLTGLDPNFVRRLGGRVDIQAFVRELGRDKGRVGSLYDANVTAFDPSPYEAEGNFEDAILDASRAPLTRAAVDFYGREMGYRVDRRYELLNGEVSGKWRWGDRQRPAESVGALREALALDPKLRVLVAHGSTDLVTPYMESKMVLDQLPAFGDPERVALKVYPGGHMFYTRDASRAAFEKDVRALYEATAR
ncbi:S10 family peptidase [Hansschlegelia sp.]|uniref:S10 family peptidase n=1 Tax=Hansschlegelia sp. TaxID=2041892 RepID=UPI002BE55188|nr:peptidase S10 [Hansschlegelia sp.]HVI28545.1 peptidase S10 [Hansschlegelia sp.]